MNERIRELYYECCDESLTTEQSYQKFAELIVRECISKIESKRSSGENNDQWTFTRDLCYHNMILDLKEHFGVKE